MSKKIVIISAHPDDEILGAGGTLLKHKEKGDEICWIIATNVFVENGFSKERVLSRQAEINEISNLLDIKHVEKLEFPTMSLSDSNIPILVDKISKIFNVFQPEIIYTLNRSDAHSDHRILFQAVMSCTKTFRYPFIKQILMYECLSETEFAAALPENVFLPNYFIDISDYIEKKCELMKVYASEISEHPFPRSLDNIKALAHFRGASCGVKYAEAFQLLKFIDKN